MLTIHTKLEGEEEDGKKYYEEAIRMRRKPGETVELRKQNKSKRNSWLIHQAARVERKSGGVLHGNESGQNMFRDLGPGSSTQKEHRAREAKLSMLSWSESTLR